MAFHVITAELSFTSGTVYRIATFADDWTKLLEKAPFNISLNAHTHKYAYHPKGELGNNYPVIIGGGYKMDSATVMILEKKNDELRIKVLNVRGEVLLDITV